MHQHLQDLGMAAAEDAPYLLHVLGVPDATAQLAGVNPQTIRLRSFAALHQLLLRQSRRQPLLVVVENLHWIDPTSQEFLVELVERLAGVPLLLLATCRPGYRPPWMDKSYATQLTLPQLGPEDSQQVVQAVLPAAPLQEDLLQDILMRAAGNPLFVEELAWTVREHGGRRLPPEIPTTVQVVLAARIDRLPAEAKRLLQTAAVIGFEVPWPLLQAVAGMAEDELRHEVQRLLTAEFLYETRFVPEGVYTFKHALTHEVAYASLLQEQRRALHARIVEAMEGRSGDRLAEPVERLAHHAFRGEVWDKAAAFFRQAGAKALARSAYYETALCFEQALEALQHLPESRDTLEQTIDLPLDLRAALIPPGEFERLLAYLNEAETLAQALNDQRRLARATCYMSNCFTQMGERDRGIEFGQRALTMARALGDFAIEVQANYFLGQAYYSLGDHRLVIEVVRRNVVSLAGDLLRDSFGQGDPASVSARAVLVRCLAEVGEFAEGIVRGEEAIRIAEASDHPHSCFLAYLRLGNLYLRKGDLHHAIPLLEQGLGRWQAYDLQRWFPSIASPSGLALVLAGRVAEAMPLLEQTFRQASSMTSMNDHSSSESRLSEAFLLVGRMDEAIALAGRALDHARAHKERGHTAWALRLLGEIAVRQSPPDIEQAECHHRQALVLAEELGMRPLQAHCHLGLGMLYVKMNRWEQARAELSIAIELYRAMEMTFWLPQAEAALAQVGSSLALSRHR
jgi:tetratricopeptide (TPR) repeat protein